MSQSPQALRRALLFTAGISAVSPRLTYGSSQHASQLSSASPDHPRLVRDEARQKWHAYCVTQSVPSVLIGSTDTKGNEQVELVTTKLPSPWSSPPMAKEVAYPVGSVGKLVLGIAVLQTLQQSSIDIDALVARYLPSGVWKDTVSRGETFRQLGQHLSGLAEPIANQSFQAEVAAAPARKWTAEETLKASAQQPRRSEPGERFGYSNANSVLLAKAIETIRQKPLQTIVRDLRTSFSGVDSSWAYLASDVWRASGMRAFRHAREGRPIGYGALFSDVTMYNPSWAGAGGDWSASIRDLLAFGRFLLLQTAQNKILLAPLFAVSPQSREGDRGYGFHCMRRGDWFGHTGDVPGFSAALWIHPPTGTCLAALSNLSNTSRGKNPADELLWLA